MSNNDVRTRIAEAGLKHWEVAYAVGVSEATLCVWLRKPLTEDRRNQINAAINTLCERRRQEVTQE